MKNSTLPFNIDLVYLWVDGSDENWLAKKNEFLGKKSEENNESSSKARYANNDELKYSLRSVEKYAPWIQHIFIVTDGQKPKWLETNNTKITIIDIKEILPATALPCFNSVIIEHHIHKIPELSEHFLYANDDMFFNKPVSPSYFFTSEGNPIVRLKRSFAGKYINIIKQKLGLYRNIYRKTIDHSAKLIAHKFGVYYEGIPHHNIDAYRKSSNHDVAERIFLEQIKATEINHLRSANDIQRIIYLYYALATNQGKLKYVNRYESGRMRIHKTNFRYFLEKYKPTLFCLNDSHRASDQDRAKVQPLLQSLFPDKSNYEK